jgi:UDP-N-acetylglucosamine--N-acetylmuramyl-(pentapeptide) pyrophosphoryl-undecaprenol N-acetylglucosamine transferase
MKKKVIISGGGTGGHVFPAIAIANALKRIQPDTEILFVGAEGKIEMQKVPAAGYAIEALPVRGFERRITYRNFATLFGLFKSIRIAARIIKKFKPDVIVGVGGYASGPIVYIGGKKGVPTLIQEQNSYAGITNKLLARNATKICVAYDGMEKFFDQSKLIKTGNPVRKELYDNNLDKESALGFFGLSPGKKTILVLGGSGGARTINDAVIRNLKRFEDSPEQLIWQTGKYYYQKSTDALSGYHGGNIVVFDFINRMDMAFKAADVVVSRAGAGTISELCLVKKATILVPSPNVAEDHQTKNALALVRNEAAILVADADAGAKLIEKALDLCRNQELMTRLGEKIGEMAIEDSDMLIASEIFKL